MKINKDIRVNTEGAKLEQKGTRFDSKFQGIVLKQNEKLHSEQLNALIKNIDDIGNRLAQSQNLKDLTKYKTMVKQFVREAVDFGLELKKGKAWDHFGQGRDLTIVQVVDEQLIELTKEVTAAEKSGNRILDKIGEIKGLLINLYA